MNNKDIDAQFLCKDCTRYNLCEYYHRRRKDSYICKYFHLSVTPQEPKIGHWIGTRRVGCGFGEYKEYIVPIKDGIVTDSCHCSECGEWLTGSDEYECYGNYCPNCGARMVESQESEDKE